MENTLQQMAQIFLHRATPKVALLKQLPIVEQNACCVCAPVLGGIKFAWSRSPTVDPHELPYRPQFITTTEAEQARGRRNSG